MKIYPNKTPKQLIIDIRKASGMTDIQVADAIGVNQSTISRLRAGVLSDTTYTIWRALAILYHRKVNA